MDLFKQSHWNYVQTLSWLMMRSEDFVRDASDANILRRASHCPMDQDIVSQIERDGSGSFFFSLDDAAAELSLEAQTGTPKTWGLRNGVGDLAEIPPVSWSALRINYTSDLSQAYAAPWPERPEATAWHGLLFERAGVLKKWPDPLPHYLAEISHLILSRKNTWHFWEAVHWVAYHPGDAHDMGAPLARYYKATQELRLALALGKLDAEGNVVGKPFVRLKKHQEKGTKTIPAVAWTLGVIMQVGKLVSTLYLPSTKPVAIFNWENEKELGDMIRAMEFPFASNDGWRNVILTADQVLKIWPDTLSGKEWQKLFKEAEGELGTQGDYTPQGPSVLTTEEKEEKLTEFVGSYIAVCDKSGEDPTIEGYDKAAQTAGVGCRDRGREILRKRLEDMGKAIKPGRPRNMKKKSAKK